MMQNSPELRGVALAALAITAVYVVAAVLAGIPGSGNLVGHLLGVVGFVLMILTEVLYSVRKRTRRGARWGSMQSWLRLHIFTGIVGPLLVLLHTSWNFNGLAGVVTLLTLVVVASGFVGRYFYTMVPRSLSGVAVDSGDLESEIAAAELRFQDWVGANPGVTRSIPADLFELPRISYGAWSVVVGRPFVELGFIGRWWRTRVVLRSVKSSRLNELGRLIRRRRDLHYQKASLVFARSVMALWHSIHVPIGVALFTTAFIHVAAALYYVTLAR